MKLQITHALTALGLLGMTACSGEGGFDSSQYGDSQQEGTVSETDDSTARSTQRGPGSNPNVPTFNLLPEEAKEGEYWESTVGIDDQGEPYLIDAVRLSEEEMLEGAEMLQAIHEGKPIPKAWGQVPCNATNFDPLVMTQGDSFTGNRICLEDSSLFTDGWFFLGSWVWGSVQISSNIGSVGDANEFQFETWTDATVEVTPQGFPGPITYPSTAKCWENVDTDGFGVSQVTPTGQSCHRYVTWVWLGPLPAQF